MKEILHLGKHYFPDYGGIETATQNLAEAGRDLGFSVSCVTAATKRSKGQIYEVNGVKVRRAHTFGRWLSTPLAPGLLRVRRYSGLILHVHLPNPLAELSSFLHLWWNRGRCRFVPFFHALPFRGKGIGGWWFRLVTRRLLDRADSVLVSHEYVRANFRELTPYAAKIHVAPFITNVPSREQVGAWWRESRDGKLVVSVGRLVPYKGHDVFLKAWKLFVRSHPGYRFLLIGEGPQMASIKRLVAELGLEGSVTVLGPCTQEVKEAWLQKSSLFVLASLDESETFGIAAQEAMAFGLPLIASSLNTGLKFLVREGKCGAAIRPGDVPGLASALEKILEQGVFGLESIGQENRRFVEENFSRDRLMESYAQTLGL